MKIITTLTLSMQYPGRVREGAKLLCHGMLSALCEACQRQRDVPRRGGRAGILGAVRRVFPQPTSTEIKMRYALCQMQINFDTSNCVGYLLQESGSRCECFGHTSMNRSCTEYNLVLFTLRTTTHPNAQNPSIPSRRSCLSGPIVCSSVDLQFWPCRLLVPSFKVTHGHAFFFIVQTSHRRASISTPKLVSFFLRSFQPNPRSHMMNTLRLPSITTLFYSAASFMLTFQRDKRNDTVQLAGAKCVLKFLTQESGPNTPRTYQNRERATYRIRTYIRRCAACHLQRTILPFPRIFLSFFWFSALPLFFYFSSCACQYCFPAATSACDIAKGTFDSPETVEPTCKLQESINMAYLSAANASGSTWLTPSSRLPYFVQTFVMKAEHVSFLSFGSAVI